MTTTTTVEFAYFEAAPFVAGISEPDGLTNECAGLPESFREELFDLLAHPDSTRCARCTVSVGFVLAERGGVERPVWHGTGLAREGTGPVAVLCEECTPYLPETDGEAAK